MTDKKRDKNGKFAAKQKPPENPDCEPATKGYVKCLIRKTNGHRHWNNVCYGTTLPLCVILWVLTVFGAVGYFVGTTSESSAIAIWLTNNFGLFLLGTLITTVDLYNLSETDEQKTTFPTDITNDNLLRKYEKPVCKDKDICEEEKP